MSERENSAPVTAGEAARAAPPCGFVRRRVPLETTLFSLSAAGVPIGIVVLRRLGRQGGLLLEAVIGALWVRASAMLAAGTARRLRLVPRLLLFAEMTVDGLATGAGFWAWVWHPFVRPALVESAGTRAGQDRWRQLARRTRPPASGIGASWMSRVAIIAWIVALLLHTARMAIYISPSRGLRNNTAVDADVGERVCAAQSGAKPVEAAARQGAASTGNNAAPGGGT